MGQLSYTTTQVDEAVRLILEPAHLAAQLNESGSPITTPIPVANTETKVLGGAGIELISQQEFTYDIPGDYFIFERSGAVDIPFQFASTQSFSQNAASAEVTIRLAINGTSLDGVYVKRTIANANQIGVVAMAGHFTMSDGDYLELYVESTKTGDFDAWSFASDTKEEGQ